MASIVVSGDSSGAVTIAAQTAAGTPTLTLPTTSGTVLTDTTGVSIVAGGVVYENSLIISSNYTLSTGKNAFSVGPITVNAGVIVTIPSGQRWVVM